MIYFIILTIFAILLIYAVSRYDSYLEKQIKEWEKKK